MLAFIISDNQALAEKLRRVLADRQIDCTPSHVFSTDRALEALERGERAPDMVFISLTPDAERAVAVLRRLRPKTVGKLVAVGATSDPQHILQAVHAGTDDYLDETGDLERQIVDTLDRIESWLREEGDSGKTITVMSSSGGAGRSLIATNLAVALAQLEGRSCLCDLDLRRGDLAPMLNLKPRHTIIDLCAKLHNLDQQMFNEALDQHVSGVHLLAAPQRLDDVQQVTSDGVEKLLQFARTAFPFVVIDLEDFFHREQFRVLQLSDVILFPLRMDFNALRNVRRTRDYLEKAGINRDRLYIIANQYGRQKELTRAQAEEALEMKIAGLLPDDPKTVLASLNCGEPVMLSSPKSKLAKAVKRLAESMIASMSRS